MVLEAMSSLGAGHILLNDINIKEDIELNSKIEWVDKKDNLFRVRCDYYSCSVNEFYKRYDNC